MGQARRYVLISPTRDEAAHAAHTLESVVQQTVRPTLWVIVDDGSRDATPRIVQRYADRHDFIHLVRRPDRGRRQVGPGVVDAFYAGLACVDLHAFDYLCKLDLDLELPRAYFETLIERMEADPRLGTCSGKPYFRHHGRLESEGCGDEMSVGMTKFYRTRCFEQIGGFVRQVMWDGIDCHACRFHGWRARSDSDHPALQFVHRRPMGSSDKGVLRGRMRHGYGQYFMGTGPLYLTASAVFRLRFRPKVIGALAMWWGYMRSWARRKPQLPAPELRAFIRRYQWDCLLRGKAKAIQRLEAAQAPAWYGAGEAEHLSRQTHGRPSSSATPETRRVA